MQAEQPIEPEHALIATGCIEREFAANAPVPAITIRRCECEAVHRTAQDDEYEARIAAGSAEREPWHRGDRQAAAGGAQEISSTDCNSVHVHLRWKSGDASSSVMPCCRLSARAIARRVDGVSAAPSTSLPSAAGSRRPADRRATVSANSMRL